jgi:uncharacterized protein (TIGR02145 family)
MNALKLIALVLFIAPVAANGQVVNSEQSGSFEDPRDHQEYRWKQIGTQIWMSQNLNIKGTKGSYCYNSDTVNCQIYGRLYDWSVAQKICPVGWHLPTHQEWTVLSDFLNDQAGEKLKEIGNRHWNGVDAVTRGESGFNALASGYRGLDPSGRAQFVGLGDYAYYWTSSIASPMTKAWCRYLTSSDDILHPYENWKEWGYSVRCVKD